MELSIITAIHNGLEINQLFLEYLKKHTKTKHELIIINNSSTDGSKELFVAFGAKVIDTNENLCYRCAQNLGIANSQGDYLCFLNNDVIVGQDWDTITIDIMKQNNIQVASPAGIDERGLNAPPIANMKYWFDFKKEFKGSAKELFLAYYDNNFDYFCKNLINHDKEKLREGINGPAVFISRKAIEMIKGWNIYVSEPDWHLGLYLKKRELEKRDITRPYIVTSSWIHHFSQYTINNGKRMPFTCEHKNYDVRFVWSFSEEMKYWKTGHFIPIHEWPQRFFKRRHYLKSLTQKERLLFKEFKG